MIYNYFKTKKKQAYEILDFFKHNQNYDVVDFKIKKKISKLNEFQFIRLLCDFILYKSFDFKQITEEELEYFIKKDTIPNIVFEREIFFTEIENNLNCKKKLKKLFNYYLNTKEYPKEVLKTKLLCLKDFTSKSDLSHELSIINLNLESYINNEKNKNLNKIKHLFFELINFEKEKNNYINQIDNKINSFSKAKTGNYLISVPDDMLRKLYRELEKVDFIELDRTSEKEFIEVLKADWENHKSIIYFKMDNIQFNYFIKRFEQEFDTKIQMTSIEYAGNIENKNGKIIADSVYASNSKGKMGAKKSDLIDQIFDKIKK